MRSFAALSALLLFSAPLLAQEKKPEVVVKHAGAMRITIREGNMAAHAALDTLLNKPHVVAIGPVEGLKGEITVVNSKPFVTKIKGIGASTQADTTAKAAFLVYAQVPAWKEYPIPTAIKDVTQLQEYIRYISKTERFETNQAFPFLIRGKVESALIHVVNKTDDKPVTPQTHDAIKASFEITNQQTEMVGFYSTRHQGIFTHHGSFTHIHLITQDQQLSGHLDDLKLVPGKSVLLLPDLPESQRKKRVKLEGGGKKAFKLDTY